MRSTRVRARSTPVAVAIAIAIGAVAAGCGGEDPPGAVDGPPTGGDGAPAGPFLPMVVGAQWSYQVTKPGDPVGSKTTSVEALEDVGGDKAGVMAYRVRTTKPDGASVSWQEAAGDRIVRHREDSYDAGGARVLEEIYAPSKLRLDETDARTAAGASWQEEYDETVRDLVLGTPPATVHKVQTWTVEAVDEAVTVPAGTFACLRVHRVGSDVGQADKTYWFARGVGKVKEAGGQTEELTAVSIP